MEQPLQPSLEERFTLEIEPGALLNIGRLATGGERSVQTIAGGTFDNGVKRHPVLAGSETMLSRADGVTTVDAVYFVSIDDAVIRLVGTGFAVRDATFEGARMSLVFEVDQNGAESGLADRAFVAERPSGSNRLRIALIA